MNINKLTAKFEINKWLIYNNDILRPFINAYYSQKNKNKFSLFNQYIFNPEIIINKFLMEHAKEDAQYYPKSKIFCSNGKINFRNKHVLYWLNTYKETFVGLVKRNDQYWPLFLHLHYDKEDEQYIVNGYHIWTDSYDNWQTCKKFSKIKNKTVYIQNDKYYSSKEDKGLYISLLELGEKTNK